MKRKKKTFNFVLLIMGCIYVRWSMIYCTVQYGTIIKCLHEFTSCHYLHEHNAYLYN